MKTKEELFSENLVLKKLLKDIIEAYTERVNSIPKQDTLHLKIATAQILLDEKDNTSI